MTGCVEHAHNNNSIFGSFLANTTLKLRRTMMSDRSTPSNLKLELKDLVNAVRDVIEWHDLGLELGLPESVLQSIEADHRYIGDRRRMMLSKWLDFDQEASWEKLIAALMTIRRKDVAENIRRQQSTAVEQDAKQLVASASMMKRDEKQRKLAQVNLARRGDHTCRIFLEQ